MYGKPVKANEATAGRRRVYFHLVLDSDNKSPANGEGGQQPQISTNGGAWTNTGISTLTLIGNGRYYADLTQAAVASAGDSIETRYKSANTPETPGDSIIVVGYDPYDTVSLGLTRLDTNVASRAAPGATMVLDLTQGVPTNPSALTLGQALLAAIVQGLGEWERNGSQLLIRTPDGNTLIKTFDLQGDPTAPTARVTP